MIIGLDFDNTIVCYNKIFHNLAVTKGLIPKELPAHKLAIRDYLRNANQELLWTLMQGEVYGTQMSEAEPYPFVAQFISNAQSNGHTIFIVSHKTKYPFMGPKWDLHEPAKAWIKSNITVKEGQVFLEPTKESKLARIAELQCDCFIDDLPEILTDALFPVSTSPILFDPDNSHSKLKLPTIEVHQSWESIHKMLGNCGISR